MRRLILAATLTLTAVIAPPSAGAETGAIRGTVLNASLDRAQPGLRVVLVGSEAGATEPFRRTAVTDERGRFAFEDLPTGPTRVYAVQTTYKGGLFAGPAQPLPDDTDEPPVYRSTLRIWETSTDPTVLTVVRDDLFVVLDELEVGIIEAVTVYNASERAYIGRGDGNGGPATSLGFALPDGATFLGADVDRPDLLVDRREDFGVGSLGAIPPGEHRITYSYRVPGTGGVFDLTRSALYRTGEFTVFAAPPLEVESNRLEPDGHITLEGQRYDKWTTTDSLDPADPVQIVATARGDSSGILLTGVAVGGVLAVVLAIAWVAGRKRGSRRRRDAPPPVRRDELLVDVAQLDIAHDAGEVGDEEWAARRTELTARLARTPEKTP